MRTLKLLILTTLLAAYASAAANTRSFVSQFGNDGNTCASAAAACLTFQGALAKTISAGEIDVLDPGDYGPVSITQSVTIDGASMGTVTDAGANAININIVSGNVTLRNMTLLVLPNHTGIAVANVGYLLVDNVKITGSPTMLFGITASTGTIVVSNAVITGATSGGDGVSAGLQALDASTKVMVNNSDLSNNSAGVMSITGATVQVDSSVIQLNHFGVDVNANGSAATGGTVRLSNTTVSDNTVWGLHDLETTSTYRGAIISFGNNRIYGNAKDGGFTLTPSYVK